MPSGRAVAPLVAGSVLAEASNPDWPTDATPGALILGVIGAIVPYFVSAWLLLSVILFVQQASRFSDIFFSINIPSNLIWQLAAALIPNVVAFTCPMAALVGIVIGLTKMQGDSELVAIRAAAGRSTATVRRPVR